MRHQPTAVACKRCAEAVDINTAAHTGGYCLDCAPALPGMDVEAQIAAAAAQQGEDLTGELQRPGCDISRRAGEMERNAPLFFGTGDNPSLF